MTIESYIVEAGKMINSANLKEFDICQDSGINWYNGDGVVSFLVIVDNVGGSIVDI